MLSLPPPPVGGNGVLNGKADSTGSRWAFPARFYRLRARRPSIPPIPDDTAGFLGPVSMRSFLMGYFLPPSTM